MKKKIFDVRLFLEGMRQLRVLGLVSLAPLLASAIIPTIQMYSVWNPAYTTEALRAANLPIFRSAEEMHPFLLSTCLWLAPLLTISQFSFLTTRKGSDFYHAVPEKRICVYFSFLAAILVWIFLLVFGSAMVSGFMTMWIDLGFFSFNWAELFRYALGVFLSCVYVSAATSCAVSISGTTLSHILLTIILVFAPRLVFGLLGQEVVTDSGVLIQERLFLFGPRFHLPTVALWKSFGSLLPSVQKATADLYSVLPFYSDSSAFYYGPALIYTVVLGVLFGLSGAFLYSRRKSEAAGRALSSPLVRSIFRILAAFLVCLVPIMLIVRQFALGEAPGRDFWIKIILFYLVSVLVFFAVELAASRKLSSLKKALPSLAILPGLNILAIGIMILCLSVVSAYKPSPSEIESIRFLQRIDVDALASSGTEDYFFMERASLIPLESETLKELASTGLQRCLEKEAPSEDSVYLGVSIRSQGRDHDRKIVLSQEEYHRFTEELKKNEAFICAFTELPSPDDPTLSFDSDTDLVKASLKTLYTALQEDVRTMDSGEWVELITGSKKIQSRYTFRFSVRSEGSQSNYILPLSKDLPNLYKAFWALRSERNEALQNEMLQILDTILYTETAKDQQMQIVANTLGEDEAVTSNMYIVSSGGKWMVNGSEELEDQLQYLTQLLKESMEKVLDPEQPMLWVAINTRKEGEDIYRSVSAYFAADPASFPELHRYFNSPKEERLN